MKKIKVAVDIRDLRIAKTGALTYLEEICREFRKEDEEFEFVFIDTNSPVYTGKNKIGKLLEHFRFLLWKQLILPLKAKSRKCDILFCTDYFVPFFRMGLITIPVFHDTFFWEYPQHYNRYWLFLFHTLSVNAAKKSFCIITPTQYTRKKLSFYTGLPESKIIPVYEAPKSLLHSTEKKIINGIKSSNQLTFPYLLHVGTFEKRKNLGILIEAFEQVHQKYPALKLILIGQPSPKQAINDYDNILHLISQKKMGADVILPGYVSDEALYDYYENAKMYVFPSRNEGFGIPVLEAFAFGLNVIIANNSCLPEIAGNAALSFDPDNKQALVELIELIYTTPTLQKDLEEKARLRLQYFSWEKAANEIKEIFRMAYAQRGSGQ